MQGHVPTLPNLANISRCIVPPKDLDGKVISNYGNGDVPEYSIPVELKQYKVSAEIGKYKL